MFPRWLSWLLLGLFLYLMVQGVPQKSATQAPVKAAQEQVAPVAVAEEASEQTPPESTPVTAEKHVTTAQERTVSTVAEASDLERWKRVINPDYAKKIQCTLTLPESATPRLQWAMTQDKPGNGSAASCSQTIAVKLTVWNARGEVAYTATQDIMVGAREVAAGLDAALLGIRPGGVRTVVMGPDALTRAKDVTLPKPLAAALGSHNLVVVTVERLP